MKYWIDRTKAAIKNHTVFNGLAVDDRAKFADMFLRPEFHLIELIHEDTYAHVIFEIVGDTFKFHLVNFTAFKTQDMTEHFVKEIAPIICFAFDLKNMEATAERKGMERKLERLGFEHIEGKTYRGNTHVF